MMLWGIRRNSAVGFFAQKFLAAFFQNPFFLPKGQNSRKSCNMRYNVFLLIRQDRLSRKAIRERRSNLFYRQLSKGHIFDCSPIFNRHIFLSRLHSDICWRIIFPAYSTQSFSASGPSRLNSPMYSRFSLPIYASCHPAILSRNRS